MRAKFICEEVRHMKISREAILRPVMDGSQENRSFAKYTPAGSLTLTISAETEAYNAFTPGKQYYLDITEASE